jgi:signal peptidase I
MKRIIVFHCFFIRKIPISLAILILSLASILISGCLKNISTMKVEGTAMNPSFRDGDRIFVEKETDTIRRGDIVIFHYPKDRAKLFIKRVIGLPGEIVIIRDGRVFINDQELEEPYVDQTYNQSRGNFPPIEVSDRRYFVLGDNRDNSSDSRSWGTVKEELIVGKYRLTY